MSDKDSSDEEYSFKPFDFISRRGEVMDYRPIVPLPRSGHRVVCDDGNLYSYGGYNPYISPNAPVMHGDNVWMNSCPLFKELWRYNIASNTWIRLLCDENMPNELASNAVILNGPVLMVFGGTSVPFGSECSNQLHVYNLRDGLDMIPVKAEGDCPPKQYGQALVLDNNYIYTVGGTTGYEYSADVHRLNLQTRTWEKVFISKGLNGDPPGRYRHELGFDGTRIYVLGGGTAAEVYGFEEIAAFNVSTKHWESLAAVGDSRTDPPGFPVARRCHGCVQLPPDELQNSAVIISGGYDGYYIFSDVWKLEFKTLQWTCLKHCSLPRPVYFHSAAITPAGQMFTFGGIVKLGNEIARTSEIYSVWVCIPKLSEICWDVITHHNPDLYLVPQDRLLNIGVPLKFIRRLR